MQWPPPPPWTPLCHCSMFPWIELESAKLAIKQQAKKAAAAATESGATLSLLHSRHCKRLLAPICLIVSCRLSLSLSLSLWDLLVSIVALVSIVICSTTVGWSTCTIASTSGAADSGRRGHETTSDDSASDYDYDDGSRRRRPTFAGPCRTPSTPPVSPLPREPNYILFPFLAGSSADLSAASAGLAPGCSLVTALVCCIRSCIYLDSTNK